MNHREQTGPLKVNYQGHRGGYTIDNANSTVEYAFVSSRELAYAMVQSYNAFDELLAALRDVKVWLVAPATDPATVRKIQRKVNAAIIKAAKVRA